MKVGKREVASAESLLCTRCCLWLFWYPTYQYDTLYFEVYCCIHKLCTNTSSEGGWITGSYHMISTACTMMSGHIICVHTAVRQKGTILCKKKKKLFLFSSRVMCDPGSMSLPTYPKWCRVAPGKDGTTHNTMHITLRSTCLYLCFLHTRRIISSDCTQQQHITQVFTEQQQT